MSARAINKDAKIMPKDFRIFLFTHLFLGTLLSETGVSNKLSLIYGYCSILGFFAIKGFL
jgi:hypothetical protein